MPIALIAHALAATIFFVLNLVSIECFNLNFVDVVHDAYVSTQNGVGIVRRYYSWLPIAAFGVFYILGLSALAFWAGRYVGKAVIIGPLRMFARHKWIYEIIYVSRHEQANVQAHVMTHIRQDGRVLMYRGYLEEFYFAPDGSISYLLLNKCHRLYLHLNERSPETSPDQHILPLANSESAEKGFKPFLMIEGEDIANVVFERRPSVGIADTAIGTLDEALKTINSS